MVYLSSSKISLAVLGNMGFALALTTYKVLLRVRRLQPSLRPTPLSPTSNPAIRR